MSTPEQNYKQSLEKLDGVLAEANKNVPMPKGFEHLTKRLANRPDPVRNDAPPAILNAPAAEAPKPSLTFRAYQDGTFAKFTTIKDKPGWYALCLNTSAEGQKDILHEVAAVCDFAIANMLCEGTNLLIGLQLRLRIEQEALKKTPAAEQTIDVPGTVATEPENQAI